MFYVFSGKDNDMYDKFNSDFKKGRCSFGQDDPGKFSRTLQKRGSKVRNGKFLSSNDLRNVVLWLLSETPLHGYEIIKKIEELSSGIYAPSPGMVYPLLTYLEEIGHTSVQPQGIKKLYVITEEGREELTKNREKLDHLLDHLKSYGARLAHVQNNLMEEELMDQFWGNSPSDKEAYTMRLEFHHLRYNLKAALFSKRNASLEERKRILTILDKTIKEILEDQ